uniref:Uncharacterized protein n=1 Tax=Clandestinovirus TaxID=2831644 RepID=A0A8F8KMD1_9VIRU|nr:hypothetical protein KOM_12_524 [Clandestinovirus]
MANSLNYLCKSGYLHIGDELITPDGENRTKVVSTNTTQCPIALWDYPNQEFHSIEEWLSACDYTKEDEVMVYPLDTILVKRGNKQHLLREMQK